MPFFLKVIVGSNNELVASTLRARTGVVNFDPQLPSVSQIDEIHKTEPGRPAASAAFSQEIR